MNEDVFNTSIRKFLKRLGVTAQREIEKAVRQGVAEGKLKGNERFPAEATVTLGGISLSLEIKGEIELEFSSPMPGNVASGRASNELHLTEFQRSARPGSPFRLAIASEIARSIVCYLGMLVYSLK